MIRPESCRWLSSLVLTLGCLTGGVQELLPAAAGGASPTARFAPPAAQSGPLPASAATRPVPQATGTAPPAWADLLPGFSPEPTAPQRVGAALLEAIELARHQKFTEAIAVLEAAKPLDDSGRVQQEIDRLTLLASQIAAAERMVEDIEAILQSGRADEASRLAADGLREYGGTPSAAAFARLKLQADAILAGQMGNQAEMRTRLIKNAEAAVLEGNLRAAAIAYEQALLQADDPGLRKKFEEVRSKLAQYDALRQRAQELRGDPQKLEEAIASLEEAAKIWNTLELQQALQEARIALQNRRDRLSVAEFEVRGDVGIPEAGKTIAEELLPAFKPRFDLVERAQADRVAEELKLRTGDILAAEQGREELGRILGVRYLVVGSVTRLSGLTVNARLVDLHSGLIVQTARVFAATPDELLGKLPVLAAMLQMNDEEKLAFEQKLQEQVKLPPPAPAEIELPPAPEVPAVEEAGPPPIINVVERPPEIGQIRPEDLDNLPPAPHIGQPIPEPQILVEQDDPLKRRLFNISIELGDNLFLRGWYREAFLRFEFAYTLYPDYEPLRIRLDRCRPYLPPPVILIAPPPPRIVVLDFLVIGRLHPALGAWVAADLAPYFSPPFEVVDRGELYWYMSRMGLTMRDLIHNPFARRWLGRAMNVRFFVFGVIRETLSFDVHTHLVDAENGFVLGRGRMHVRNTFELKLRLRELALITRMDSAERARYLRELPTYEVLIADGRRHFDRGEFVLAIEFFKKARSARPHSVQAAFWLQQAEDRLRRARHEADYRKSADSLRLGMTEWERRQLDLLRRSELERLQAEQEWARKPEADRLKWNSQRDRAFDELMRQGRAQLRAENYAAAIRFFESAIQLDRRDEAFRELAAARAAQEEAARRRAAELQAQQEAELRKQRERELAEAAAKLELERKRREAEERAKTIARLERERQLYDKYKEQAEREFAKKNFAAALSAIQSARQIRRTKEIDDLHAQVLLAQQRDAAQDAEAKRRLEERLAEEERRRKAAEEQAAKNRLRFEQLLRQADQALRDRRWDNAIAFYNEAGRIQRSDEVLTGLRRAQQGKEGEQKARDDEAARKLAEQRRAQEIERYLGDAKKALAANRYEDALKAFRAVLERDSGHREALAGVAKAQSLQSAAAAAERRKQEEAQRLASFKRLLESGQGNLAAKRFEAAVQNFTEALRYKPNDPQAEDGLKKALAGRDATVKDKTEAAKRAQLYQKYMDEGRAALNLKRYDAAIRAFQEAQKVLPGDQTSLSLLKEAERLKSQSAADLATETKKRQEELKRAQDIQRASADMRAALAARDPTAARKALMTWMQLAPNDPQIKTMERQLQQVEAALRAEQEERKKLQARFDGYMKIGRAAMQANRYDEAVTAFSQASQLLPDDKDARGLLAQAIKARDAERTKLEEAKRLAKLRSVLGDLHTALKNKEVQRAERLLAEAQKLSPNDPEVRKLAAELDILRKTAAADAQRKAQFDKAMQAGRDALAKKRFDDAIRSFQEAQKLFPNDRDAANLLNQAIKERDAAKPKPDPKEEQYRTALTQAQKHEKQRNWADAVKYYRQALDAKPNDPAADAGWKNSRYELAMQQGEAAMRAKLFKEAVNRFQEALQAKPNDPRALKQLKAAQAGKP